MRMRPSVMPAAALSSGVSLACVVLAGWEAMLRVSPRLAVRLSIFRLSRNLRPLFEAAFELEADDAAAVVHLASGDRHIGGGWGGKGISDVGDSGMGFEGCGDVKGVGGMSFHSDVEGLEASAEDPGVEGGEGRAGTAAEKIDLFDQFLFPDDGAAEDAALAVNPFGCRVDDKVGAVLNGRLADGGSEAIIDVEEQVVLAGERRRRLAGR